MLTRIRARKFVFINFSDREELQPYHGKAIALDIAHHYAPFPSIFLIHEMRVRGFHPFNPVEFSLPSDTSWQDWVLTAGVYDAESGFFIRDAPDNVIPDNGNDQNPMFPHVAGGSSMTNTGENKMILKLNEDVIRDILMATHAMPSWKACEIEGTSWDGTAEENIKKYSAIVNL